MSNIKTLENTTLDITKAVEWLGVMTMTVATLTGLAELPNFINSHTSTIRSEFALVSQTVNTNNPLLREKDEAGPHYVTYTNSRTPYRSGKR
jgi:hypothetical protein